MRGMKLLMPFDTLLDPALRAFYYKIYGKNAGITRFRTI